MKSSTLLRCLTLPLALSAGLAIITIPTVTLAQPQQPSRLQKLQASLLQRLPIRWETSKISKPAGAPSNREGGASRSSYGSSKETLIALRPETNVELTLAKYPTFFVYLPPSSAETAEFALLDENDRDVYRTTFATSKASGVVSLSLPAFANLKPLEAGKAYHWYFSLIHNPEDRSKDTVVEGWIQRVEPSPTLGRELEKATMRDRVALYANSGIWYDALATLAELHRSQPNDPTLSQAWEKLLGSAGLSKVSQ